MPWKNIKQTSLVDALATQHNALKAVDDVHALIDWNQIEHLLADVHANKKDKQAWPPLMKFKAMLLQSWHNLSDAGLGKLMGHWQGDSFIAHIAQQIGHIAE